MSPMAKFVLDLHLWLGEDLQDLATEYRLSMGDVRDVNEYLAKTG